MRLVFGTTVAVNRHQSFVRQLNCVAKATAAAAVIDVTNHDAVVFELPRPAAVVADNGTQAEVVAVGRVAANGERQQQPVIFEL